LQLQLPPTLNEQARRKLRKQSREIKTDDHDYSTPPARKRCGAAAVLLVFGKTPMKARIAR